MRQEFFSIGGQTNKTAVLPISPSQLVNTFSHYKRTTQVGLVSLALFLPSCLGSWLFLQSTSFDNVAPIGSSSEAEGAIKLNAAQVSEAAPAESLQQSASADDSSNSVSNSTSSQTSVKVNGQTVTGSTSPSKPTESINKTINTNNGSTNVSIQSNSQSSSRSTHSFQNVQVNSFSSGDSSSATSINQFSSGGNH